MRAAAIVNPAAGAGGTRRKWRRVRHELLARGIDAEFHFTTGPRDGIRLAREAACAGFDTIIAVGGDGTVNEVGNGILASGRPARLAMFPTGTGRDLGRCLGINSLQRAADALASGRERPIDAGLAEWTDDAGPQRRYFFLECGTGFVTDVNRAVTPRWKRLGRTLPYVLQALARLRGETNRPLRWHVDGQEDEGLAFSVTVFNGEFFGGGMNAAPGAALDDGLLDVMGVGDVSRWEVVALLALVYRGKHLHRPKVWRKPGRAARVDGDGAWFDLDGEVIGPTPVEVSVVPGAITLAQ